MFLLLSLLMTPSVPAITPTEVPDGFRQRIAALVREAIEHEGVPGISVAVGEDGRLVLAQGWGYADASHGVPATADTAYEIGSLARQFTAVAILELAESGALALDDPLAKWVPEFPTQDHKVTLHHLLSGTSGIPSHRSLVARHADELERGVTRARLFEMYAGLPFEFAPGAEFDSESAGYLLLAMVVAKASGMPYSEYVRTQIFEPAALDDTRFLPRDALPVGLARDCKEPSEASEIEIAIARALEVSVEAPTSTVVDLFRWQCALDDRTLIDEASARAMSTPVTFAGGRTSGHGFANDIEQICESRVIAHTGGTGGFRVRLAHYEARRLTVVVLANCASAPVERLERAIARVALELAPEGVADVPIARDEIARLCGSWQIETQRVLTFEREGKLWFEFSGRPAFPLAAEGKRSFRAPSGEDLRIRFAGEVGDESLSFEMMRNGLVSTGRRMG